MAQLLPSLAGGALLADADVSAAEGGLVLDFPGDAGGALVLGVPHGALVAVGQGLAHLVDDVHGHTFASAVVVVEVAPAPVLVQGVDGLADLAGEGLHTGVLSIYAS